MPLQRAIDRAAERALPGFEGSKTHKDAHAAELFREAVRMTVADRDVTERDEAHLERLAARLGLSAEQAASLRRQAS